VVTADNTPRQTDEPSADPAARPDGSFFGTTPALTILAACALIFLLRYMQEVLIPFVLAGLTFYALDPMVDRLQRWRVPRALGAAVMLLIVLAGVGGLGYSLADDVVGVINDLPSAAQKLRVNLRPDRDAAPSTMDKLQEAATELDKTAAEAAGPTDVPQGVVRVQMEEPTVKLSDYIRWGPLSIVSLLGSAVMVLFLAYFLLLTDDLFKRKLVELAGSTLKTKKVTVEVLRDIALQIEAFILVQVFTSTVVGVATWLALWWFGLDNAPVWGLFAGLLNSVPYFGPLIVTGGLTVVAYVQFGTLERTAAITGIALLITTLEGWILTPMLMGKVAQINTVAIFAGLVFWSWMWGIWGLLLAVPLLMVIKSVCDRIDSLQPIGKLLGD